MTTQDNKLAWYKVKMVWLVLAIPAATVAGCLLTIYLAVTHPDSLVNKVPTTESSIGQ